MAKTRAILGIIVTVLIAIVGFSTYSGGNGYMTWFGIKLSSGAFMALVAAFVVFDVFAVKNAFGAQKKEEQAQTIARKLHTLVDVGLGYIKLGQPSSTLSGGESQRIKLAYFLSLSEERSRGGHILFLFDEPTTGLHFYDVEKLLKSFDALLDRGHTVVVVEHNIDVIKAADWIIDMGPDAGDKGGEVVFEGTPEALADNKLSFTAEYLR